MAAPKHPDKTDKRIEEFIRAAERMQSGEYEVHVPLVPPDELGQLGRALTELAHSLERRHREVQQLDRITTHINEGLLLDEILEGVYENFRSVIPFNRIGFSLIEDDGETVTARWARTDQPEVHLDIGYHAPLSGSSLEDILLTNQPRILNDLEDYLRRKPESESTRLVVAEGIRSSLTCPLIANGVPVGFVFFSSTAPHTYDNVHVETFMRIAGRLAVIVEKGRMVSKLAQQKAAIERQNEALHQLNETKNAFLGMAAHDLRNPIGYIQMATDFILNSEVEITPEEELLILEDIRQQSDHMLALLNDLLDVAQIEAGKLEPRRESFPLLDFLAESVARHSQLAAPKGTTVRLVDAPPGDIHADPARLRQVMDNLISNAVKYAPAETTVYVEAARTDAGWRITVQDEGPGIAPEERDKLFTEFARLSTRPTGGEKSTGLGLAITRRIVEAHGGQIGVESAPGGGAAFWFTLPEATATTDKADRSE